MNLFYHVPMRRLLLLVMGVCLGIQLPVVSANSGSHGNSKTESKDTQFSRGDFYNKPLPFHTEGGFRCEPVFERNINGDPAHWRVKSYCYQEKASLEGSGEKHQFCEFVWDSVSQKAFVRARKTVTEKREEMLPVETDVSQFRRFRMLESTHELPGMISAEDVMRDMHIKIALNCAKVDSGKNFKVSFLDSNPVAPLKSGWSCEFRRSHVHGRETARAYLCSDPNGEKSCQYMVDRFRNQYKFYESTARVENRYFDASEAAPIKEVKQDHSYSLMRVSGGDFHSQAYEWLNENCGS